MATLLEQYGAALDSAVSTMLGDTIRYARAGGDYVSLPAFVDDGEDVIAHGNSAVVAQAMVVEIDHAILPERPVDTDRIIIAAVPNKLFKPVGVRLNATRTGWLFTLQAVVA